MPELPNERNPMKHYADLLLEAIVSHDPSILPLAPRYRATENSIPAALGQMRVFALGQAVNARGPLVVDEELGQVVVVANLQLGGAPATFWARIGVEGERIAEIELYHVQSAAEGGYVMLAEEVGHEPAPWHAQITDDTRASREELVALGRGVFIDREYELAGVADECWVMEQGGIVMEYKEFSELAFGDGLTSDEPNTEKEPMLAGLPPFRPHDPEARLIAFDTEGGYAVTIGLVPGYTMPTVTSVANTSAFVPAAMHDIHGKSILPKWLEGRSVVAEDEVTCVSMQILRYYDGKLQGLQMFNSLTGAGARPVWLQN